MFSMLLESTPHRKPSHPTALVSAVFHLAVVAAAIYLTASGAGSKAVATVATRVTMIRTAQPSAQPKSAPARPAPKPKARPVAAPTKIPTETPPPDPNARPTTELETGPTTSVAGGGAPGAFNAFEVDIEVVGLGGGAPRYPDALRSRGTEGQVTAQFVVNEKGRADRESFKVLSTTHQLFADAVSQALPQMRFRPAQIGGKPVSQLVQQLFVFKLDR